MLKLIKGIKNSSKEHVYAVFWKILNSKDYSAPQSRSRVYIVCIHKCGRRTVKFTWPKKQTSTRDIKSIFDKGSPQLDTYDNYPFPAGKHKALQVRLAIEAARINHTSKSAKLPPQTSQIHRHV